MAFEFALKCLVCGDSRKEVSDSQILHISEILKRLKWARAVLTMPDGKKFYGWICNDCLKDVHLK